MDTLKPIRFAIVGYGNQGKRHAKAINSNPDCRLVAIIDTKEIEDPPCPVFTRFEELNHFGKQPPDVICICTPNGLHAKHTLQGLGWAGYVVLEKPAGLEDVSYLKGYRDNIFCVMQNRFTPAAQWLKSLDFGEVYSVHVNCFWNRDERYYEENDWRGTAKMDGGVLYTQFSHFIDMVCWLFGEPDLKGSMIDNVAHPDIEIEDQGAFMFYLPNGGAGTFNYSTNAFNKNMESSITIISEKGSVRVGGQYMQTIEYCEGFDKPELTEPEANKYTRGYQGSANNIEYVIQNVVNHIHKGEKIATTIDEGIRVVDLINKIYSYGMLWNKKAKAEKVNGV